MDGNYLLLVEGTDLKPDLPKPLPFNSRQSFADLKSAYDAMQRLDDRWFDERLANKQKFPQHIGQAAIMEGPDIIVLKSNLASPNSSSLPSGVYLQINTQKITAKEFQQQTGAELSNFIKKGPMLDYYLLVPTKELRQKESPRLSPKPKKGKIIKDKKNRGQSPS